MNVSDKIETNVSTIMDMDFDQLVESLSNKDINISNDEFEFSVKEEQNKNLDFSSDPDFIAFDKFLSDFSESQDFGLLKVIKNSFKSGASGLKAENNRRNTVRTKFFNDNKDKLSFNSGKASFGGNKFNIVGDDKIAQQLNFDRLKSAYNKDLVRQSKYIPKLNELEDKLNSGSSLTNRELKKLGKYRDKVNNNTEFEKAKQLYGETKVKKQSSPKSTESTESDWNGGFDVIDGKISKVTSYGNYGRFGNLEDARKFLNTSNEPKAPTETQRYSSLSDLRNANNGSLGKFKRVYDRESGKQYYTNDQSSLDIMLNQSDVDNILSMDFANSNSEIENNRIKSGVDRALNQANDERNELVKQGKSTDEIDKKIAGINKQKSNLTSRMAENSARNAAYADPNLNKDEAKSEFKNIYDLQQKFGNDSNFVKDAKNASNVTKLESAVNSSVDNREAVTGKVDNRKVTELTKFERDEKMDNLIKNHNERQPQSSATLTSTTNSTSTDESNTSRADRFKDRFAGIGEKLLDRFENMLDDPQGYKTGKFLENPEAQRYINKLNKQKGISDEERTRRLDQMANYAAKNTDNQSLGARLMTNNALKRMAKGKNGPNAFLKEFGKLREERYNRNHPEYAWQRQMEKNSIGGQLKSLFLNGSFSAPDSVSSGSQSMDLDILPGADEILNTSYEVQLPNEQVTEVLTQNFESTPKDDLDFIENNVKNFSSPDKKFESLEDICSGGLF